jgi:hypothetical protein
LRPGAAALAGRADSAPPCEGTRSRATRPRERQGDVGRRACRSERGCHLPQSTPAVTRRREDWLPGSEGELDDCVEVTVLELPDLDRGVSHGLTLTGRRMPSGWASVRECHQTSPTAMRMLRQGFNAAPTWFEHRPAGRQLSAGEAGQHQPRRRARRVLQPFRAATEDARPAGAATDRRCDTPAAEPDALAWASARECTLSAAADHCRWRDD